MLLTAGVLILLLCGAALSAWFAFTGKPPDTDEFGKPIDHTAYWVAISAICTLALGFLLSLLAVFVTNYNVKEKIAEAVKEQKEAFEDVRKSYGVTTRDLGEQIAKLTKDLSKSKKGGFKSPFSSSSADLGSAKSGSANLGSATGSAKSGSADLGSAILASPASISSPA